MRRTVTALLLLAMLVSAQAFTPPTSTNPKITRVVVLVLENRCVAVGCLSVWLLVCTLILYRIARCVLC